MYKNASSHVRSALTKCCENLRNSRLRCFVISVNNYTIEYTFYFKAARRVEGNYVKTRTNNQRIFHANGHEKEERRSRRSNKPNKDDQ